MGIETAAIIGLGAATATTQVMAGRQQAKGIQRQAEYNAQVYEQQAEMIQQKKKIEEYQYNRQIAKMRGAVTARAAGRGLLLSGSPLAILIDNETQMRFDQAIGEYNLDVQRNYALSGAEFYRTEGKEKARLARMQGYTNAFSTLLNTAGSAALLNYGGGDPTKGGKYLTGKREKIGSYYGYRKPY